VAIYKTSKKEKQASRKGESRTSQQPKQSTIGEEVDARKLQ